MTCYEEPPIDNCGICDSRKHSDAYCPRNEDEARYAVMGFDDLCEENNLLVKEREEINRKIALIGRALNCISC